MNRVRLSLTAATAAAMLLGSVVVASGDGPQVHVVAISKLAFGTTTLDAHVNDVVEWANDDILQHTATATDGSFDVELPTGSRGRVTLNRAGVITYICRYHPGMKGQLVVRP